LSSTFNNYLNDSFKLSASARGFLEFPRELPGFLIIFVTGALAAFPMRSWAVLVGLLSAVGVLGLGFLSPSVGLMSVWMLSWSMADHLFMPVESGLGLHLAQAGKQGRRLGQISGWRNMAMIFGSGLVWILASRTEHRPYALLYVVAAVVALGSMAAFWRIHVPEDAHGRNRRFVWRRRYSWFYWLNILFGARKQIFLTFAPWVLVTKFGAKPETMALLIMFASLAGVVFRQAFGIVVDKYGERKMFVADALILLVVCGGFAFTSYLPLLFVLYIVDNLMFATRIARTTYLNKIAVDKKDIPATLSLGVTMDHMVSMTVPALGGLLWNAYGYHSVFLAASFIAGAVLVVAWQMAPEDSGPAHPAQG
jgi:predicted MFS family arabinose efflux permease